MEEANDFSGFYRVRDSYRIKTNSVKMAFCITIYNEGGDALENTINSILARETANKPCNLGPDRDFVLPA